MKFKVLKQLTQRAREFRKRPTLAEETLWKSLRNRGLGGFKFRRQQPIEKYIVDFICLEAKLVVEVDGDVHKLRGDYDAERTRALEAIGFRVIRFRNEDLLANLNKVLEEIYITCDTLTQQM